MSKAFTSEEPTEGDEIEAPEIGPALFGPVSIDRFQRALYWTTLARRLYEASKGVIKG